MHKLSTLWLPAALLLAFPLPSLADHEKHERREFKEEYWDGNCKVERKFEKNGEYKEERKCKGARHGHHAPAVVYVPAPVVVEPGVRIHGTIILNK